MGVPRHRSSKNLRTSWRQWSAEWLDVGRGTGGDKGSLLFLCKSPTTVSIQRPRGKKVPEADL